MTASWAAVVISAMVALLSVGGLVANFGRRDGKVDAILAGLVELTKDHEIRIRDLEVVTGRHRRR